MSTTSPITPTHEGSLQRGKACLSCRRRKMKCDGTRPICNQCIRSERGEDCEYTDQQGRTRTQVLEEDVARLEARIRELENPDESTPSVTLHDPHARYYEAQSRRSPNTLSSISTLPLSYIPGTVNPSGLDYSGGERSDSGSAITGSSGSSRSGRSWWEGDEPPSQVSQMLVNVFMPWSGQLGFFLHAPRFLATLQLPQNHSSRPHPALLNSIYTWSTRLSSSPEFAHLEPRFLGRAVSALTSALGDFDASARMQALQAEVLLAQYFFCFGRFLEGRYHANAAVSLALSSGLHAMRIGGGSPTGTSPAATSNAPPGTPPLVGIRGFFDLAPSRDFIEDGERIAAFWTVFNIDRCWSVAVGSPSLLCDDAALGTQIDTPWPLEVEDYELCLIMQIDDDTSLASSRTVQEFFERRGSQGQVGQSRPALRVKAAALFERVSRLVARYRPGANPDSTFVSEFRALERTIAEFIRILPSLPSSPGGDRNTSQQQQIPSDTHRTMLVTHGLAHAAQIQLQHVRADSDSRAHDICVASAGAIVRQIEYIVTHRINILDPIIGTVWMVASRFYGRDIVRMRGLPNASRSRIENTRTEAARVSHAMDRIEKACPVLGTQIGKVQEVLSTI